MERLTYKTLRGMGYNGYLLENAPERVLQFGEGNFLRAFVNCFIDQMNEKAGFNAKVVLVQPIAQGLSEMINEQDGLYTLYLRGMRNSAQHSEKRVISCVSRCINPYQDYRAFLDCAKNPELRFIVSNTTEAGIAFDDTCEFGNEPPSSFPAKLTRFMYERYTLGLPGFVVLSCELIDDNGKELEKCVGQYVSLWGLPEEFAAWVTRENLFCSTLVDRIVTGYPRAEAAELNAENGYEDKLLDTGELFGFWVIEGPDSLNAEFPAARSGLPVLVTADHSPYKQRKVRILNGAHTALIPGAFLSGRDIVRDCMKDTVLRGFMNKVIYGEIIPTLTLPESELLDFAAAVADRFENPFIDHELLSIALNSASKWRARLMPSLLAYYEKFNALPPCITASFAAYIEFYRRGREFDGDTLIGGRNGADYAIKDDKWVLDFFYEHRNDSSAELARAVINNERMWGGALSGLNSFENAVAAALEDIWRDGVYAVFERAAR